MARSRRQLSPLYFIADVDTARRLEVDLVDAVREFVRAGGRMVSLRCSGGDDRYLVDAGIELAGLLTSVRGHFLVHRRVDIAILSGADGVHLPSKGLSPSEVRNLVGGSVVLGRSCHDRDEIARCSGGRCTFATLGPCFESVSKPGYGPGISLDEFAEISADAEVDVYALGGVLPENLFEVIDAGAAGVAVVGGILGADSPFDATRAYIDALSAA